MAQQSYSASAPGNLMLMGEHAVLARKAALVCAINKRIRVTITPNDSQTIIINDEKLGTLQLDCKKITLMPPFQFVLAALIQLQDKIKTGFHVEIEAEFSSTIGFGSSAAVTVATIAALSEWLYGKRLNSKKIFKLAKAAVLLVQGSGSGADVAASVYGGVLRYQCLPLKIIPLPSNLPEITAVYCGYKKPTKEVIALVQQQRKIRPQIYSNIFKAMHSCVIQATQAIRTADWHSLGALFMQHQGLQYALGVSDGTLDTLVRQLHAAPQIYGAKISGSGLGDCVIGLGGVTENIFPCDATQEQQGILQFALNIDQEGIIYADH